MIRKPVVITRGSRRDLWRGGQAFTGRASISRELKSRVLEIDKTLELHDFDSAGIHMYRVKTYGVGPNDILVHQFELKYPPGEWLIECLKTCDTWSQYGSPEKATQAILEKMKSPAQIKEEEAKLRVNEISQANAKEYFRKAVLGRKVFI